MTATTHSPIVDAAFTTNAAAGATAATPAAHPKNPAGPPTILVVDDHAVTRDPLARLLRYEGYRTVCAANGAEALKALETDRPDLVLLDLVMPKVDGLAFLESARRDGRYGSLPVIVLTGLLDKTQLARVRALGVHDVLTKAKFTVDELMDHVRATLPVRAGATSAAPTAAAPTA